MSIEAIRAIQRSEQSNAIEQRRSAESITRIGDRDPVTGKHQVLDPDGGVSPQGVKIYNAQEQYGDRVLPFPRTDGTIALDSEKGNVITPPTAFPHCPGYLNGQVFNCEVPKKKKKGQVWILYAYQGRFYIGGHQRAGVLIYDPIPPNMPVFDRHDYRSYSQFSFQVRENYDAVATYGAVWGDGDGWQSVYSVRYPKKLCIAEESGVKEYSEFKNNGNYIYLGGLIGYGYYIDQYDFVSQGSNGGDSGVNFTDSWKNAIVDYDRFTTSSGLRSVSIYDSGRTIVASAGTFRTRKISTANALSSSPAPYAAKKIRYEEYINQHSAPIGTPPDGPNFGYEREERSDLLFRDRTSALFYSSSSSWEVGSFLRNYSGLNFSTLTQSGGRTIETKMFEVSPRSQGRLDRFEGNLFGIGRTWLGGNGLRSYKYNSPSVTLVDNVDNWRSLRTTNLNTQVNCSVKVYNVVTKESLVDGQHETVELTCWGVPFDAYIVDVCAWVP